MGNDALNCQTENYIRINIFKTEIDKLGKKIIVGLNFSLIRLYCNYKLTKEKNHEKLFVFSLLFLCRVHVHRAPSTKVMIRIATAILFRQVLPDQKKRSQKKNPDSPEKFYVYKKDRSNVASHCRPAARLCRSATGSGNCRYGTRSGSNGHRSCPAPAWSLTAATVAPRLSDKLANRLKSFTKSNLYHRLRTEDNFDRLYEKNRWSTKSCQHHSGRCPTGSQNRCKPPSRSR